jgi:hypothetical protein
LSDWASTIAYILIIALVLVASLGRGLLVDRTGAISAAEKAGYSKIQIVSEQRFFAGFAGCDGGDAAAFEITAINPAGRPVDGLVLCSGWPFKGFTIRSH